MSVPISVIIPTYNRANLLIRCLDLVVNQTLEPSEVIIVDDGSTDNTKEIIDRYKNRIKGLRYIYQNNQGESCARNKGLINARYSYIAFLDSDDEWLPNHLEEAIKAFSIYQQVGLVYSAYNIIDQSNGLSELAIQKKKERMQYATKIAIKNDSIYYLLEPKRFLVDMLRSKIAVLPSTMVLNRDNMPKTFFFDELLPFGPDIDFIFKLLFTNIWCCYINSSHTNYYIHSSNIILTDSCKTLNKRLSSLLNTLPTNEKRLLYCSNLEEYDLVLTNLSDLYWMIAGMLDDLGKYDEAKKWYQLSFRLLPRLGTGKHLLVYKFLGIKGKKFLKKIIGRRG